VVYSFRVRSFGNGAAVGVGDSITTAVVETGVGAGTDGDVLVHPVKSSTITVRQKM